MSSLLVGPDLSSVEEGVNHLVRCCFYQDVWVLNGTIVDAFRAPTPLLGIDRRRRGCYRGYVRSLVAVNRPDDYAFRTPRQDCQVLQVNRVCPRAGREGSKGAEEKGRGGAGWEYGMMVLFFIKYGLLAR